MSASHADISKAGLVVVDMQEDFCPPSGPLAIPAGRDIAPVINSLLALPFSIKIATADWHPADHISFDTSHESPDIKPFVSKVGIKNPRNQSETLDISIWPVHCVQNTKGAEIIPEIDSSRFDHIVRKASDKSTEMFSVFADVFGNKGHIVGASHDVPGLLRDAGVKQVFVVGLAGDFCAFHTARHAQEEFDVFVIEEAVKSLDPGEQGWLARKKELQDAGVSIISMDASELQKVKSKTGP